MNGFGAQALRPSARIRVRPQHAPSFSRQRERAIVLPVLKAELEMIYRLSVLGPLPEVRGPLGKRHYWELRRASLQGARIHAQLAMRGGDSTRLGHDGFWRPDVRLQFRTQDDAIVLLHYAGLVEQNNTFLAAAQAGRETSFDTSYMRMALQFETASERYRWLTQHLFVAKGRLLSTYELEYEVYRID